MKILAMSIGTRGDIEPFLAIAEILKEKGHQVVCAFPEQYRALTIEAGYKFHSLGPEFIDLLNSDLGKLAIGGPEPSLKKTAAIFDIFKKCAPIQDTMIDRQREIIENEKPDKILFNSIPFNAKVIYPLLWGIKNSKDVILICPIPCILHRVKNHPHAGFRGNYGTFINRLTYEWVNRDYVRIHLETANRYFQDLRLSRARIEQALMSMKTIYTISPSVFPRPGYWPPNVNVLGYREREVNSEWQPDYALVEFIERHKKILMVTFGSMSNPEPMARAKLFTEIFDKHGIPAVINLSGGGLAEPPLYNKNLIKFISYIPYDWICPKLYGVIHHGGAGTTQIALKYGCAEMVLPHASDQPLWNELIYGIGAGPKGIAACKLTRRNLEPKVLDLWGNQSYKSRALQISEKMKLEDYKENLYSAIIE